MYKEIFGNLITIANEGRFDFIAQGCNCWNTQGAGIAPHFAKNYSTLDPVAYPLEGIEFKGDKSKLGKWQVNQEETLKRNGRDLLVANIYSQYHYFSPKNGSIALDYNALEVALKSIGLYYITVLEIGLPMIGCGLAGGDWSIVSEMIKKHLANHNVTVVKLR